MAGLFPKGRRVAELEERVERADEALRLWPNGLNAWLCVDCNRISKYPPGGRCPTCGAEGLTDLSPLINLAERRPFKWQTVDGQEKTPVS